MNLKIIYLQKNKLSVYKIMNHHKDLLKIAEKYVGEDFKWRPSFVYKNVQIAKALNAFGYQFDPIWSTLPSIDSTYQYFANSNLKLNGQAVDLQSVLKRFDKPQKSIEITEAKAKYHIQKDNSTLTITNQTDSSKQWIIELKLVLNDDDIKKLINLLEAFIPYGKTVSLQADCHVAGNCFVGMVASFDQFKIPYIPISADIGCGICLLPIIKNQKHLNLSDFTSTQLEHFKLKISLTARKTLARGKKAENGAIDSPHLTQVYRFLGWTEADKLAWFQECEDLFKILRIKYSGTSVSQTEVAKFVMGFSQTLGSSGNHFLELSADKFGDLYFTVHSGSRGLGALVYERIADLCQLGYGDNSMAILWLKDIYLRAYQVLNTFAIMNRALCAIAVLEAIGGESDGLKLQEFMSQAQLFNDEKLKSKIKYLIRGLTHNGIKTFVNHETKEKVHIMCKGSIAVSKKASCSIVALRCGDGCYVFNLADDQAKWEEVYTDYSDYTLIYDLSQTDVILAGHGAGRSGSATNTWKNSTYRGLLDYYHEIGVVGNLSPNVMGDDPRTAYKPVDQIIPHLPLSQAISESLLRTLVNHKEGIDQRPLWRQKFATFIVENFETLTTSEKLMLDLILVKTEIVKMKDTAYFDDIFDQQKELAKEYLE